MAELPHTQISFGTEFLRRIRVLIRDGFAWACGEEDADGISVIHRTIEVRVVPERHASNKQPQYYGRTSITAIRPPPPCVSTLLLVVW